MTRNVFWLSGVLAVLLLLATACGGAATQDDTEPEAAPATDADSVATETPETAAEAPATAGEGAGGTEATAAGGEGARVGLILNGPQNDGGFYEGHYEGLLAAQEKYGLETSVVENVTDPQEILDTMRNLAADNELVIGGGSANSDAAEVIAPQFPDVTFSISAGVVDEPSPNLYTYLVRQGVGAFVAGAAVAEITEVNKVGYIGGALIPPTQQAQTGFEAGLAYADPSIEVVATSIGTFNDPAVAKEAANAQIANGVDVIFMFLNAGSTGVLQAIEESGQDVKALVAPSPRCDQSEAMVMTAYFDTTGLMDTIVSDYLNGDMPEGNGVLYGIDDPNVQRVELCPDYQDPELQSVIDEVTQGILDGDIELPEGI